MPLSVAIIGAGPSGLTLARLLQVTEIDVSITIFERDVSPTSRPSQGGTLDLHNDTGLAALKKAGLWDEALKHLRYDGEELKIGDKNATVLLHHREEPKSKAETGEYARPEIDRELLRSMLLQSVKPKIIQWGKVLQALEPNTGVLTFRDQSTAGPFDLVIGADGAWSKVRPLLTDIKPQYSGICGFTSFINNVNDEYPEMSKMIGRGSYFVYSDRKSFTAQRMGDESVRIAAWVMKDEKYASDVVAKYGKDEDALKQEILGNFADWSPDILRWTQASHGFVAWPLFELPVGQFWEHKKGYTMIGDAASLMTPFAGEGVNKAMKDALELAEALEVALKSDRDIDEAVKNYEQAMFPRATKYQQCTLRNKNALCTENSAVNVLVAFVDMVAEEMGYDLQKGWLAWVPVKTMMYYYASSRQTLGQSSKTLRSLFRR
ncbi:salicylate hydroxylase [Exophiala viscosa]|uniref:salicylate hydroxylase n=1 Tax=Exophiala viscosa TaxID=2486360 RepID=UPI0021907C64|nr:salicylate hydroxylase [Exophiala viscosa]